MRGRIFEIFPLNLWDLIADILKSVSEDRVNYVTLLCDWFLQSTIFIFELAPKSKDARDAKVQRKTGLIDYNYRRETQLRSRYW